MATNGIISIVRDNKVVFKCIAGCDGYNAEKTVKALKKNGKYTLREIYKVCLDNNFGCKGGCLVVQSADDFIGVDKEEGLSELYENKFSDRNFNPRWERGTAAHVEIINIDDVCGYCGCSETCEGPETGGYSACKNCGSI